MRHHLATICGHQSFSNLTRSGSLTSGQPLEFGQVNSPGVPLATVFVQRAPWSNVLQFCRKTHDKVPGPLQQETCCEPSVLGHSAESTYVQQAQLCLLHFKFPPGLSALFSEPWVPDTCLETLHFFFCHKLRL